MNMSSSLRIVVVTGLSGAGKSTALRVLEDLGFFCVDNLPTPLVQEFAKLAETRADIKKVALGIDARGRTFGHGASGLRAQLGKQGYNVSVLFLDASDEALVRRFSESRRPHPLAESQGVLHGIQQEREALWRIRESADDVIDTTLLNVHQLRRMLRKRMGAEKDQSSMDVRIVSFGFRYGVPVDADLVFDVRFLLNPYFVEELRPLSGTDQAVGEYVLNNPESKTFLDKCVDLLEFLIPLYQREGKSSLTVALGCTGGRHRSVALVEALSDRLKLPHSVNVMHRDMVRHQAEVAAFREVK